MTKFLSSYGEGWALFSHDSSACAIRKVALSRFSSLRDYALLMNRRSNHEHIRSQNHVNMIFCSRLCSWSSCHYIHFDFSMQASMASITAARMPFSSSTLTARIVVPPGEHTISFSSRDVFRSPVPFWHCRVRTVLCEFIGLFSGHSGRHSFIRHGLNKHKYICGRASR